MSGNTIRGYFWVCFQNAFISPSSQDPKSNKNNVPLPYLSSCQKTIQPTFLNTYYMTNDILSPRDAKKNLTEKEFNRKSNVLPVSLRHSMFWNAK